MDILSVNISMCTMGGYKDSDIVVVVDIIKLYLKKNAPG